MRLRFSILFAAAAAAATAAASTLSDTTMLGGVEVVAPVKTPVVLTPLTVTTVDDATIEKSAESSLLPVLQSVVPGLFVSERGFAGYGVSGGAAGAVSVRGVGGGDKVLFMIDGQPQFAGIFGHALPDTYVANGVERVEIVRGPSSLLYGSGAMGGSVNIVTRRASKEGVAGRARAMFGSFSTQSFNTSVSYRRGRLGAVAAGQVDRSNGNRSNSEFWLANEYLQLQYAAGSHWQASSTLDMTQTKSNNPGTTQSPLVEMWTKMSRGTASLALRNRYERNHGGIQAYVNWGSHHVDDGHAPGEDSRDYLFRSTDYNMGVTAFQTVSPLEATRLSVGLDFVHWGGHSWNVKKDATREKYGSFRAHVNEVAPYLMVQQGFFGNRLDVNAGVRLQHSSQYGNEWVPQAGFILRPFAGNTLKFSFGKGFRAPNLRELYLYRPANPRLTPEYMLNYEVEWRQRLLGGRLDMGLALYFIDGKDMIQTVPVDGRPLNMNVGAFINKGFELDASFMVDSRWSATANYSYLHTSTEILYAPRNKLTTQLNFVAGCWSATAECQSIWGLHTGSPEPGDYALLNFRGSYSLPARTPVSLTVKADNLTDKHYEVIDGCPMPGFTVMGGIEIRF